MRHRRASEAQGADFLQREMKVGVCRPCVLPSGLGHTPGLPGAATGDRTRDIRTSSPPLVSSGSVCSSHRHAGRGATPGRPALHTTQHDLSAHNTSKNILQKRKLRLEMALGQGSTQSLGLRNSRETKSPAGLGAKCLLCRITSTWLVMRAATQLTASFSSQTLS